MSAVMEERTFRGLREVTILASFASALFLLIALVTFNHEDGGWLHPATTEKVMNACGVIGAWLADICLNFFGLIAYLFPLLIFWQSYLFFREIKYNFEKRLIIV